MTAITPNYTEMTPAQYGKLIGLGKNAVIRRCEAGQLPAYKTEGGYWKIRVAKEGTCNMEEIDALRAENERYKATIEAMRRLLA